MLSKRYESTEVDRRTWLHVPFNLATCAFKSFTFKCLHSDPHFCSTLQRQSSKREVVGSNPTVGKNLSCCNSRFLCVATNSSNQTIQMKSIVKYTYTPLIENSMRLMVLFSFKAILRPFIINRDYR